MATGLPAESLGGRCPVPKKPSFLMPWRGQGLCGACWPGPSSQQMLGPPSQPIRAPGRGWGAQASSLAVASVRRKGLFEGAFS